MNTTPSWRETATKVCAGCTRTFRPGPKQKRAHWESVSNCSTKCGSAARRNRVIGDLNPADQHTPGARIRWLRLSTSASGRKQPISQDAMALGCQMSRKSLASIEQGQASVWGTPEDIKRLCDYLRIDPKLLRIPTPRWVEVVTAATLTARELQTSTGGTGDVATDVKISRKKS
jgi:transcriptional regulator with XRE-family HTH domain